MIKIKSGVTPPNLIILAAVANAAQELGLVVTITSGTDGVHMTGSKHYIGAALDVRSHDIADKKAFLGNLRKRLGAAYYCFLESPGTPNEHFHCEYDASEANEFGS